MKPVLLLAAMLLIVSSGCDNTDPVSEISLGTMPNVELSEIATIVQDWAAWRGPNGNMTQSDLRSVRRVLAREERPLPDSALN
jgi:hypothetical protein